MATKKTPPSTNTTTNAGAEATPPASAPLPAESAPVADASVPPAGGPGEFEAAREEVIELLQRLRTTVAEVEQMREQLRARVAEITSAPLGEELTSEPKGEFVTRDEFLKACIATEERAKDIRVLAKATRAAITELAMICGHNPTGVKFLRELEIIG